MTGADNAAWAAGPLIFFSTVTFFSPLGIYSPPHPVTKYCITMPMTLEATQYKARPLGKERLMNTNIIGIIHNII
jgi:hypothetical protein